jgi:hypothetical protein
MTLVGFAADLDWLKRQGIEVERYNLSQQPAAFVANSAVSEEVRRDTNVLPILLFDGEIVCRGRYPIRTELADMLGIKAEARPGLLRVISQTGD